MGTSTVSHKTGLRTAIALIAVGWLMLLVPLESLNPLVRWSCDSLQFVLPSYQHNDLVIVYIDDDDLRKEKVDPGQAFPRSYYTALLNQLANERPKVVVLDIMMLDAWNPAEDADLAKAIALNSRVVLAAERKEVEGPHGGHTVVPPLELLKTNAAGWGFAKVVREPDRVARRFIQGDAQEPDLVWAAAEVFGAPVTRGPERGSTEKRWLNYYGSGRPFSKFTKSYGAAREQDSGFFKDKIVVVGGKLETKTPGSETDFFAPPFSQWNGDDTPGVQVAAIAVANLVHDDWLRRLGITTELCLLCITGAAAGFGLRRVSLRAAGWLTLSGSLLVITAAIVLVVVKHIWTPWAVISLLQLPAAALLRLIAEKRATLVPQSTPATAELASLASAEKETSHTGPPGQPEVADHTLIRCVGEGAYGQVWIARNAIGLFHAVKVIYRSRFPSATPYERAFRGIQKFMPISRSHDGFVHILQVGRNDRLGLFYYVMEAGDDVTAGQQIDATTYAPRTLARELRNRGALPPSECRELLLALSDAVERLHQHQLVHRDIKPDNIIFVRGRPKLADIDLVTDLSSAGGASYIGTEGYLAPEGPGSAAADVFSLGRVLYVALTGKPPDQFPELPTTVTNHPDCVTVLALNRVACKAAEYNLERRYPSAQRLHDDLLAIAQPQLDR